jgi:hypothetical protein
MDRFDLCCYVIFVVFPLPFSSHPSLTLLCEKEKDKANKRILRSLSFDNNGLVKPSCGTVALYGPFGFFLRYGRLSMNNLG